MIEQDVKPPKKQQVKSSQQRADSEPSSPLQQTIQINFRQPPIIPQFIQQQISAETKENVLASLHGWTSEDYDLFISGLVTYSEEKDINVRCKLIAENYLSNFTPEEIKRCFLVLSNVAKAKERDEPHDEFANIEARTKAEFIQHYHQSMRLDKEPDPAMMHSHPFATANRFNPAQQSIQPLHHMAPYPGSYIMERRASVPGDLGMGMKSAKISPPMYAMDEKPPIIDKTVVTHSNSFQDRFTWNTRTISDFQPPKEFKELKEPHVFLNTPKHQN
eukprot:TRINITY_DN10511_c0_g1_i1.p1 TRINITY_DN10511_c0_g1~~TRINITY_DN10511_c0_g1_i1.p1  ORF type:complete len:275 (-),score=71.28 TRINITY_DN10511_c0_g1_i1:19-843(-)